ncbi:MBL fold metallo-hydrolase [Halarcobacter anaerophilus]|uniref:MBL fold metallo-hydrolase n=1 Tax=Halarcobacter anaerophilus TaxID=877500 RepID=UPI0005C88032
MQVKIITKIFDKTIKAVFLTHFHADHTLGLLKLRYGVDKVVCYHPEDKMVSLIFLYINYQ